MDHGTSSHRPPDGSLGLNCCSKNRIKQGRFEGASGFGICVDRMLPTNRVQGCACHWCPIGVLTCVCLAFKWFCIWQGASVSCLRFTMADNGRQWQTIQCQMPCLV